MDLLPVLRWLAATLLLLSSVHSYGQPEEFGQKGTQVPVIDISALKHSVLHAGASYWVTDRDLTVDQLPLGEFQPLTAACLNRGITDDYHWVRVRLDNLAGATEKRWVLYHETSYLDELSVHYADNGGVRQQADLSDRVPFSERPFVHRTLAFEHATPAGGYTDLWLRLHFVKADTLTLNLFLSDVGQFASAAHLEYLLLGSYYGLMLVLLIIALLGAFILRQSLYLFYAFFLISSLLTWAQLNGLSFQYLWPNSPWWHNEGFNITFLLTSMSALQFSRIFLKTKALFPRVDRLIKASLWLMTAAILARFLGVYVPVLYLSHVSLAALISLAVLGFMAYRRGLGYARWYSVAWVLYGLGLLVSVISAGTSLFNWGMAPLYYAQAGGALEAIFLLIALGEKLVGWDRDRRVALAVANEDPLTGLGNRRAFEEAFDRLQRRSCAGGKRVFLVLIDLDLFKVVNDRYGHDAGDEVLKELGQLLRRCVRPEDVCVRFGGEEFALLLQAPSARLAMDVAERIRAEFAAAPTLYQGEDIEHTLSAGLAEVGAPEAFTRNQVIRMADRALYAAKAGGRNRICLYGDGPESQPGLSVAGDE
ncbi:MAG: sensor domain-containing diguanylate cyclase [Alteromonadaceae bacterium]|nr:sensor domain-containing diguanylate cyclase [Alteromonadaceae bacterium]|tara:strand:+ start:179 stop:1957 length:1779 start_codon:yes stop_codon:yes gene_type:complete